MAHIHDKWESLDSSNDSATVHQEITEREAATGRLLADSQEHPAQLDKKEFGKSELKEFPGLFIAGLDKKLQDPAAQMNDFVRRNEKEKGIETSTLSGENGRDQKPVTSTLGGENGLEEKPVTSVLSRESGFDQKPNQELPTKPDFGEDLEDGEQEAHEDENDDECENGGEAGTSDDEEAENDDERGNGDDGQDEDHEQWES